MRDEARDREAFDQWAKEQAIEPTKFERLIWQAALAYRDREGWIPVSERLPEVGEEVIVVLNGRVAIDSRHSSTDELWSDGTITEWRPLPSPPEGKEPAK